MRLILTLKKGRRICAMGITCDGLTLDDLYKSYSDNKHKAFETCKEQCNQENGFAFRVGKINGWQFKVTWLIERDGKICRRIKNER